MNRSSAMRTHRFLYVLAALGVLCTSGCAEWRTLSAPAAPKGLRAAFMYGCDRAVSELEKPYSIFPIFDRGNAASDTHHMPAFEDAHAVRALAVAYDLTRDARYLGACQRWADWVLACQKKMIPGGAYYMNHSRAPGEDRGQWNAADSGTVGMGVLATAMRCSGADRDRYLQSVERFLELVRTNYVKPEGGISNGCWPEFAGPWWCSSATVGKLALLYGRSADRPQYAEMGLRAMTWLARQDFRALAPITFDQRPSGTIFYCFDFYATGLPDLPADSPVSEQIASQFGAAAAWLAAHQHTQGDPDANYAEKNVDMSAMPSLMLAFARRYPARFGDLREPADRELVYLMQLLSDEERHSLSTLRVWEPLTWSLMSFAERLAPGSISEGRLARR